MKDKRRRRSDIIMLIFRLITYGCIFLSFFGLMSVNSFAMLTLSRTSGVTLITFVVMAVVMNTVYGGYAVGKKKSKPVISSMSLAFIITDLVTYLQLQIMNVNPNNNDHLELFGPDFPMLLLCMVIQVALIVFWVRLGNNMYFRINPPQACCVVLGPGADRDRVLYKIGRYRLQYQVTDIVDCSSRKLDRKIARCETVFLCGVPQDQRNALLIQCYQKRKNVLCLAELEDIMVSNAKQTVLDDAPFLEMESRMLSPSQRAAKRALDLAISVPACLVLSPVMLISAAAVRLCDGGPAIFSQKRVTENGRVFNIYKFRTMRLDACRPNGRYVSVTQDDLRITKVGSVLRKLRLDELPQLWNIVKGDMSLVGPRPEMVENVIKYKQELPSFIYRERMKAGLTGYAQIEGKYNTTAQDKLMLDLMYIESYSLWLDIKLLFRTLLVFFKSDSTEGFVPPPPVPLAKVSREDERRAIGG